MRAVPYDPALPSLRAVFQDEGAPQFVLEALRPMSGLPLDSVRSSISYVRYRPGRDCIILWTFERTGEQPLLLSGTMFRDNRGERIVARRSFQELAARARRDGARRPYAYLPEHGLLLQLFPLDMRVSGLVDMTSDEWRQTHLRRALPGHTAGPVEIETVTYKPRHRYVARVSSDGHTFYAKTFRDARGRSLFTWLRHVDDMLRAADAPWTTPRPVAYLDDARTLVLKAVEDSVELKDVLKQARQDRVAGETLRKQMALAAQGLAQLQRVSLEALPSQRPRDILRHLAANADGIEHIDATLAASIARRLRELEVELSILPPEPLVTAHGAFRHDQIIVQGDRQVALDMDTVCLSGASHDAGNFLSYLDVTALRRRRGRAVAEQAASVFEDAALDLPGVSREWLGWYRRAGHLKKALRSFLSLDRKWPEMAEAFLDTGHEVSTRTG